MQLYHQHSKTARRALQGCFLQLHPFHRPQCQTDTSGYNTACATLVRITAPQHIQRVPNTNRHAGTLYSSAQPAYYNNVYKGAKAHPCYRSMPDSAAYCRPCQPGGVDRWQVLTRCQQYKHGAPAEGGAASPPVQDQPGGRSAAGGAEPLAACAASLFGLSPDS